MVLRVLVLSVFLASPAMAAGPPPPPTTDVAGAADSSLHKHYQGSVILTYEKRRFAEFSLPLAALEKVPGQKDMHNNTRFEPKQKKDLEGAVVRLVYVMPAERTPLEVIRNYRNEIKASRGKVLFECKAPECGGDPNRNSTGGGGNMSLAMYLFPAERVKPQGFGWCTASDRLAEVQYLSAELPAQSAFVSVLAATLPTGSGPCAAVQGRTIAMVDVIQTKAMENKMVTVQAAEMAEAIAAGGKVALYGIYFDTNKADVKQESETTLAQIGKLLQGNPKLKLVVAGHTDNVGGYAANVDLSQRRAAAVVKALTERQGIKRDRLTPVGISSAAPVASNKTDEGRAKNRRVELVEN